MSDYQKLLRIQLVTLVAFIIFKLVRRPLLDMDPAYAVRTFLLSFPNFCEAIIGVMTLTVIGFMLNNRLTKYQSDRSAHILYISVTFIAAIYVLTQEFRLHNLGGNNIFDPMDAMFSIIGLIVSYAILLIIRPKMINSG